MDPAAPCPTNGQYCRAKDDRVCICAGGSLYCPADYHVANTNQEALTGSYRGQDNQGCLTCAQANCAELVGTPSPFPSETRGPELLACALESGCAGTERGVSSCYCGTESGTDCVYEGQNGACQAAERAAGTNTTPLGILAHFFDASRADGDANRLARCLVEGGCTSCFRSHEQNACPRLAALNVTPARAAVGRTLALRAAAEDPDQGPGEISYRWEVNWPGLGSIADAHAANTTFTCAAPGNALLTLTLSDADAGCAWSTQQVISCYQAPCLSIEPLSSSSRAAAVGESVDLSASVLDREGQPAAAHYAWSVKPSEGGVLSTADLPAASYTCTSPGVVVVSVTASDASGSCTTGSSIGLTCLAPDSHEGPATTQSALTGDYRGLDNQACWSCARAGGCVDQQHRLPCEYRANDAEHALCLQLLQCELETGCGVAPALVDADPLSCYCRHTDGCLTPRGVHDGACAAQLEAGLGSNDPSFIANHLVDPELPGGPASVLASCLAFYGCAACFPAPNACPVLDRTSATPAVTTVGSSITLDAHATDPDSPAGPLYYSWLPAHTDRGDLGSIADPNEATARFTCELAGSTDVALSVSDGACTSTAYVTVSCVEP